MDDTRPAELAWLSQAYANALSAENAVKAKLRKLQASHLELIRKRKSAKRLLDAEEETYHHKEEPRADEVFAASGFQRMKEVITT